MSERATGSSGSTARRADEVTGRPAETVLGLVADPGAAWEPATDVEDAQSLVFTARRVHQAGVAHLVPRHRGWGARRRAGDRRGRPHGAGLETDEAVRTAAYTDRSSRVSEHAEAGDATG